MRIVFLVLGVTGLILWGVWYFYISAMACAFSGPGGTGNCRMKAPWELNTEDFMLLVGFPGIAAAILFGLAWVVGRRKTGT